MSIVIIGGDYLDEIEKNLYSIGAKEVVHISGRKKLDKSKMNLPKSTTFILVLTDYVNHNMAHIVKGLAKSRSIPMIYTKRSWPAIEEKVNGFTMSLN